MATGSEMPLNFSEPPSSVPNGVDPPGEMRDLARGKDLARLRPTAQSRGQVQRPAPIPALHGDGLAGVEADADRERQLGLLERPLDEPLLEVDRGADASRAEANTHRASSPRSSSRVPPRPSTVSRAMSANFAASFAAASSPRSCVNSV
jgi:hypothetical protein